MSTARKHLGCAVYQDYIYAVGGRDDSTELNSVERYSDKGGFYFSLFYSQMVAFIRKHDVRLTLFYILKMTVGNLLLRCKLNDLELD